jgi:hypothetical protein
MNHRDDHRALRPIRLELVARRTNREWPSRAMDSIGLPIRMSADQATAIRYFSNFWQQSGPGFPVLGVVALTRPETVFLPMRLPCLRSTRRRKKQGQAPRTVFRAIETNDFDCWKSPAVARAPPLLTAFGPPPHAAAGNVGLTKRIGHRGISPMTENNYIGFLGLFGFVLPKRFLYIGLNSLPFALQASSARISKSAV